MENIRMTVHILLLRRKDLQGKSVFPDEQVFYFPQIFPGRKPIPTRDRDVEPSLAVILTARAHYDAQAYFTLVDLTFWGIYQPGPINGKNTRNEFVGDED